MPNPDQYHMEKIEPNIPHEDRCKNLSTATMENSVEIPSKTGNRTAIQPSNPTDGQTHQGNQN